MTSYSRAKLKEAVGNVYVFICLIIAGLLVIHNNI